MKRAWIGLALLSVSWLLGSGCYHPANWTLWTGTVVLGTILLASQPTRLPGRREIGVALAMMLPAVWLAPWPYRAAPLWIVVGLGLQLLHVPRRWPQALGWGAVKAGVVLLGQGLILKAHAVQTARCHDLPGPLVRLVGGVASLLGIDAAVDGSTVAIHSVREINSRAAIHYMAATWDLLVDPSSLAFLVGGLILLAIVVWSGPGERGRWSAWGPPAGALALVTTVWLPFRAGLLTVVYLHRVERANPNVPLTAMSQFFSTWVSLLMLAVSVLLAWRFVRLRRDDAAVNEREDPDARRTQWSYPAALALFACAVATVSFLFQWEPVGRRKAGRVMFVERHSTWEPTDLPYDKEHFGHDPSYSYNKIYDYCSQYYQMSRLEESDAIDHAKLSECDVLVVKIPTGRFSPGEVRAIERFVERGGGLLLVGDHTNVFKSGTYLNDVSRPFGFTFRHDLLFAIDSPYDQKLNRPIVPHPVVQHLPPMVYAVSCSIDPGASRGRAVVRSPGLWSLPSAYHTENFHPHAEYRPEMRFGSFIQLWSVCHGSGRVLAFTDSTIFSSFCIFQPGKAELMVGMLEWLNHTSTLDRRFIRACVTLAGTAVALALLVFGSILARDGRVAWLAILAAAVLGWTVASIGVAAVHRRAMPEPPLLGPTTRLTRVGIDRTVSEAPLSLGAFVQGDGVGYGLLEQWIPRSGYYTERLSGPEAFSADALVVICPTRSVPEEFREGLVEYVSQGGRVLIVDSPDVPNSTANSLLWPFKMWVNHATDARGEPRLTDDSPLGVELEATCEVFGGEPLVWVGSSPVAARARHGQGAVTAIGFGSCFNDESMGISWAEDPDAEMLTRFDVLFALVEAVVEDRPLVTAPPRETESPSAD